MAIINEGGAMPGVGAIHIDEIEPTLDVLEKELGIDLKNNTLGSVGKKTFSGDIDVAIDIDPKNTEEFMNKLKASKLIQDIAKSNVIMTKVKIVGYDESKEGSPKARTGFVQVDFMPGDPSWMKTFYHAPSEKESKYKGVFRNLMITSITKFLDVEQSSETTEDGRPLELERWMWSNSKGLVRIRRKPVPKKTGDGYTKKNDDTVIGGPFTNPKDIVKTLKLDSPADLNSYESLKAAIEKNYPPEMVKKILDNFASDRTVRDIGVPDDLKTESLDLSRILTLANV